MGMWHCETTRILEINPHGNADTLEIARVWDYEVIIRKGEYKVGDLVSYLAVETICGGNPTFSFLGKDAFRPLRAKRLRGVFSQGLIVPAPPGWTEENVSVVEFYGLVRAPEKEEKIEGKISRGSDGIKVFGTSGHTESPPFPLGVYDVDPLKKFASTLEEGEEVYITEKIHGECVKSDTRISRPDGTTTPISSLKVGDEILGVDEHGRVTSTKVVRVFKNGLSDQWLNVKGKRYGAGRGSHYFSVTCTPNHRFFDPQSGSYVCASDIVEGSTVSLIRSEMSLTPIQEQVLLGKLLGDGSLVCREFSAFVQWNHRAQDKDYSDWTARALGPLAKESECRYTSGYGTTMVHRNTSSNAWILRKFGSMLDGGG